MKTNKIITNAIVAMAFASAGALTACSDWDDHYDAGNDVASANATIWQNIQANSNLSQFAQLLQKAGYSDVLNASQTYTVWAPIDNTFNYDSLNNLSLTQLQNYFVMNHIARYSYPATGTIDESVTMLNKKVMNFAGSSSYSINGTSLQDPNLISSNGILHTTNGRLAYRQNIYESLNNDVYPIDSISAYIHSYDLKKLDKKNSVQGPIVDGEITYLDSVFTEDNAIINDLYAYINREDSSYTSIIPTNTAWNKTYKKVSQYYNYIPSLRFVSDVPATNLSRLTSDMVTTVEVNSAFLKDSVTRLAMIADLNFNNNTGENRALPNLTTGGTLGVDSLMSTTRGIFYTSDANALFEGATRVDKSNGAMWVTDSIRVPSWIFFSPIIKIQAEDNVAFAFNASSYSSGTSVTTIQKNPEVQGTLSNNRYQVIAPSSPAANPQAVFYLPNVRSDTYAIYIAVVPENINKNTYITSDLRPNRFTISIGYNTADGAPVEQRFTQNLTNDVSKIDTLYAGDFTFPVSYYGLTTSDGTRVSPFIRLTSHATGSATTSAYDRNLRIDFIMLVPKELDNYIKEHPDYKYYHDVD
jgi:uncharacterized surface protein with fasciclin (FAS1) repeats